MDGTNFPIEFNNEIDDVKKSDNQNYTMAVSRLSKLAQGRNDISGGVVNLKSPGHGHQTSRTYEVTIVVYMGADHIAATEIGEVFQSTLDGALEAVERQVRDKREQERSF